MIYIIPMHLAKCIKVQIRNDITSRNSIVYDSLEFRYSYLEFHGTHWIDFKIYTKSQLILKGLCS